MGATPVRTSVASLASDSVAEALDSRPLAQPASPPLVSVLVPAYNADRWIDATLRSLRSQTYRTLEIIVIDDGSTDRTRAIVREHAAVDGRVLLICQDNAGVAAARNRGLAEASGKYIAPTDADDLSAPTRIALLVDALERAGLEVGVAYSWSALIDEDGWTIGVPPRPEFAGDVRSAMYDYNFVSNGSAAMMRADALREVGGYDSTLRARDAQGCEDWALLLALAEHHRFVCVPEFLLGYRQSSAAMSNDRSRMLRSFDMVGAQHAKRYPPARKALRIARKKALAMTLQDALYRQRPWTVARLALRMAMKSPFWTGKVLFPYVSHLTRSEPAPASPFDIIGGEADRHPFAIGDPDQA